MGTATATVTAPDGTHRRFTVPIQPKPTGLFPGDPGSGKCCYGLCHQGGMSAMASRAADLASDVGRPGRLYPPSGRIYVTPFSTIAQGITQAKAALADAAIVKAWGGLPFIDTKELTSLSFAQIGAGQMDQYIDYLVEGLVTLNWPVILGLHQEPVGDTVGGVLQTGTQGAIDYGKAVGRVAQRRDLAGGKGNISVTGCIGLGAFTSATSGQFGPPLRWFQEVIPVSDVEGSHKYLQYQSQDETKWAKGWSMDQLFGQFWALQDSVDSTKARVHGEWGVHTRAANLATAPVFMDQFLTYFIANRGRAACFFDSGLNSNAGGSWSLDVPIQGGNGAIDASRRKRFAQQLLDPRVVGPAALAA